MNRTGGARAIEDAHPYELARRIRGGERDTALSLNSSRWPDETAVIPEGWIKRQKCLTRDIHDDTGKFMAGPIREILLRFPSAPLRGWQRLHDYHVNLAQSESFHTYRVFTHPSFSGRAERIFLMHNGLNELSSMGLYYQLASYLIYNDDLIHRDDHSTVCVLRPFPGHLTRFPFQAFAETPLDRYLWDGSHLFRQFLRFMIETQWFLSTIVRRSSYRSLAGANLLGEHVDPTRSRLEHSVLAEKMESAWSSIYRESDALVRVARSEGDETARLEPQPEDSVPFLDAITSLRDCLKLEEYRKLDGVLRPDDQEPSVHVVGYSLGGFTAQSVFMSWPFLVASCVTLLSGGALRELSPTAFAHAEEWQTVLHSLRYELDDAMMSGRYGEDPAAGTEQELFLYLKRTFYEVFQQEYRGSFQSRLEAFRQRMLFVVGGNDPIVQTRSVLDSGPPGGLNMLAIGGLGHFLDAKAQDDEEREQRSFWLPEVGRLIDRFTHGAVIKQIGERPYTWLNEKMVFVSRPSSEQGLGENAPAVRATPYEVERLSAPERLAIEQDGALPSELFERCLDDLLARQAESEKASGLLFVLRNELPTMLLDDRGIYEHAAMLNHDDVSIARYAQGVQERRALLLRKRDRIALVLPWNARSIWLKIDKRSGYPSQAEAAKGEPPVALERDPAGSWREVADTHPDDAWTACLKGCEDLASGPGHASVRVYDGRRELSCEGEDASIGSSLLNAVRAAMKSQTLCSAPSLPDCWVWVSREFLRFGNEPLTLAAGIKRLAEVVPVHCDPLSALGSCLRNDELRMITVSRARYNPRFRGRVVADPRTARDLLLHVTLCLAASVELGEFDLERGCPREPDAVAARA